LISICTATFFVNSPQKLKSAHHAEVQSIPIVRSNANPATDTYRTIATKDNCYLEYR